MSAWLRMHVHALGDSLGRMGAQPLASAMSILVLGVAIALPLLAAVALRSAGTVASSLDTEPHLNVFLALDATDEDVKRIGEALKAQRDAAQVRFVPRGQALQELKASTHLAEILATLDRNPLPHAFTVRVRSTATDRVAAMRSEWASLPKVDQVQADFEWSERLARWVRFGDRLLWALAIALGAAVAFIVGHLIRLQVLTRREEIEVSQLIGATAADVRRPFLYHGMLEGMLAGAVAVVLAAAITRWIGGELLALTPSYATELKVLFLGSREWAAAILGAAVLGLAGAWIAVGRELRRFSAR
ncbi:MAG: permease-like cell division protein FtsX [Usitatibacter sp.]